MYVQNASHSLSQKLVEVSSAFWFIIVILDILVGFWGPLRVHVEGHHSSDSVSCPSLVLKPQLGLVSDIASHAHPSTSKTSEGTCPLRHFWASVKMRHLSSLVKRDIRSWQQSSHVGWWVWKMGSRTSIIACGLSECAGLWCSQFRRSVVLKGW